MREGNERRTFLMISICITVKNRSRVRVGDRELLLFPNCVRSIVDATADDDDVELVVADWQSDDWPLDQWLREATPLAVRVVQLEGGFSRGRGLNEAARKARGDILFFTDADCLLCPLVIEKGREHVGTGRAFFPVLFSFDGPDHHEGWWRHEGRSRTIKSATCATQTWRTTVPSILTTVPTAVREAAC